MLSLDEINQLEVQAQELEDKKHPLWQQVHELKQLISQAGEAPADPLTVAKLQIAEKELEACQQAIWDKWQEVFTALEERYKANPDELETVLRLGFLYWHHELEQGVYNYNPKIDQTAYTDYLDAALKKLYKRAKEKFSDNVEFVSVFAQMLSLASYQLDLDIMDEKAVIEEMCTKALQAHPGHPFPYLSAYYHGLKHFIDNLEEQEIRNICQKADYLIHKKKVFSNRGFMGEYFEGTLGSAWGGILKEYLHIDPISKLPLDADRL